MFLCSRDNYGDVILIENDWKCTLPQALKVGCIMAFHYGDSAILFIFSWYWCAFLFQCNAFPANDFLHHSHISVMQCAQWFFSTASALIDIKFQWIHPYTPHCSNILVRSSIQSLCYSCLLEEEERSTKMCFAITIRADWIRRVRSVFFYLGYPH